MKKNLTPLAPLFLTLILLAGLAGCCHDRNAVQPCPTTQPQSACTQPADAPACSAAAADSTEGEPPPVAEMRHPLEKQFDRQIHNAQLADMSVSDLHFLPHRPGLNATGTQRLSHLAWLIDRYGGKINLDLVEPNTPLARARMRTVTEFLRACGLAEPKIQVALALPGGTGMDAREAVTVYQETRFKPKKDTQKQVIIPVK